MTRFVGTPLSGVKFATVADEAVSTRVNGDTQARIRIDAGGKITWGDGSASGDTNLYRSSTNTLVTDDIFKAINGLVTLSTSGSPTAALEDGALAVDTTNNIFYFRSGGAWNQVSEILYLDDLADVSASAPINGDFLKWDGSAWVPGAVTNIESLDDINDVVLSSPTTGQVLAYNGSSWVNQDNSAGVTDLDGGTSLLEIYEAEITNKVEATYDGGQF